MAGKLTRTFSLTVTTDELLSLLSKVDERPRSAELRFLIIRYAEDILKENDRMRKDVRSRIESLLDDAKAEVYEPELDGDE